MRVGVLGGGLQGCCIALALAARGIRVTLFDRNDRLLSRAAIANEGKIHLGYMYANDPGQSTARMMMRGALAFAPFLERHLELPADTMALSRPATYVVHRDSQRTVEEVSRYLVAVHALLREASEGRRGAYFGRDLSSGLRQWSDAEREGDLRSRDRAGGVRIRRKSPSTRSHWQSSRGGGLRKIPPSRCASVTR